MRPSTPELHRQQHEECTEQNTKEAGNDIDQKHPATGHECLQKLERDGKGGHRRQHEQAPLQCDRGGRSQEKKRGHVVEKVGVLS